MASPIVDLWSEILEEEEEQNQQPRVQQLVTEPEIAVVYQRQKAKDLPQNGVARRQSNSSSSNEIRKSLAAVPVKRISWNRSLSTRGRTSIAATACMDHQPKQRKPRRNAKPPLPRGKALQPPNFDKERAYFQEVDAFELLEESPSPKKCGTWTMGAQVDVVIPHLSSVLRKWLISKKLNRAYEFPGSLSKILESPSSCSDPIIRDMFSSALENPGKDSSRVHPSLITIQKRLSSSLKNKLYSGISLEETCEDVAVSVSKLSVTSSPSPNDHRWNSLLALLTACGQSFPSTLKDMLLNYCDRESIIKVGEGTYGEAFKVGEYVCKIVPFDGDFRVNGELQKKSGELLEEVVLSCTLNRLRGHDGQVSNACTSFIQTIDLKVCLGHYDPALISAWEDWDEKHNSENDHPKEFPEDQCYVVFVQQHGGQDLESFVLLNFDEVRSLLVQVTLALAVAEAAYEFEHRDLHWGNILLSRKGSSSLQFVLEGKNIQVETFGLLVSIIDFTLSRINTGDDILFLDLSSDPELFEGRKGDIQSDTYRKMRDVTREYWEGSFPQTNVLWLQYLVDILLLKKSFDRTSKDERDLRYLKRRLNNYDSAKEAFLKDPFFTDLLIHE